MNTHVNCKVDPRIKETEKGKKKKNTQLLPWYEFVYAGWLVVGIRGR